MSLFNLVTGFANPTDPLSLELKTVCDGIDKRQENFKKESAAKTNQWTIDTRASNERIQQISSRQHLDTFS